MESPKKTNSTKGGCLSGIFLLFGIVTILISLVGYILGLFGMVLKVSGSKLPFIDLPLFLILAGFGVACLLLGWGIGKLEDKMSSKRKK